MRNSGLKTIHPLLTCALISGLIYLTIFTLPFPLAKFYNAIPPVDYAKLTGYSAGGFWRYLLGIGALFGLYLWAIRLTISPAPIPTPHPSPLTLVFLSGGIFALILIFAYPLTAIDLFIYAIRTRGWALYGLQPLTSPPEALPSTDPWLGLAGEWVDAASPYGPLWETLSLAAFYATGNNFLGHLFALKIIGLLAYLGCALLVYKILTRLQPRWAIAGTLAFAWNPLVLFESVQNGHNDILMIFFLLAAIWVFSHINPQANPLLPWLFCLLLALSVLVKFVTIIIAPFYLLALALQQNTRFRRATRLLAYGVATLAMVALAMAPLWPGWNNWAVPEAGSQAGRSLLALLVLGLRNWLGTNAAFDISRNIILAVFALIYLYQLWRAITASTSPTPLLPGYIPPIAASFYTLFWYVLLAAPVFHAWYLLWFLPLAALLLPHKPPLAGAVVFSITALLAIPYFETIRVWYPALLQNHFWGHLIGVPLLIAPPAITLLQTISSSAKSEV